MKKPETRRKEILDAAGIQRSLGRLALEIFERQAGNRDFALIGILAEIAGALAAEKISVFCVSTFDTDYVLVKADRLNAAMAALAKRGHSFI